MVKSMNFKQLISSSLFVLIGLQLFAQTEGNLAKADLNFSTGHYKEALVLYGTVTDQSLPVLEKTALSYYFINDYANAEKAIAKIIDQKVDVETVRLYAEVLLNNGKHKEAAAMYKKYKDAGGKTDIANREKIPTWAPENSLERP